MGMRRYWLRCKTAPDSGLCDTWLPGVQSWISGYDPEDWIIRCAIVDVPDDIDPMAYYALQFTDFQGDGFEEKPLEWVPGDRFPGATPWGKD